MKIKKIAATPQSPLRPLKAMIVITSGCMVVAAEDDAVVGGVDVRTDTVGGNFFVVGVVFVFDIVFGGGGFGFVKDDDDATVEDGEVMEVLEDDSVS